MSNHSLRSDRAGMSYWLLATLSKVIVKFNVNETRILGMYVW